MYFDSLYGVEPLYSGSICVVGGCGHVGLPLAVALAASGAEVTAYDTNSHAVSIVNKGIVPFFEEGLDDLLVQELGVGRFKASDDIGLVPTSEIVIIVIGTPVDEHLNPDPAAIRRVLESLRPHLRSGQLLVLRSTVYPGVTRMVEEYISKIEKEIDVVFCPERIAEGHALEELASLPQIIGARSEQSAERAEHLFRRLSSSIVHVSPEEAELAKLFTNTWRYIKFAAANQLFMMANDYGVDFERVRKALIMDYPRASDMPGPGFAAGPCLFKDTMQLAAFNSNQFTLGHASMMVNEGLPLYLVSRAALRFDLPNLTTGILGMSFKGESDDTRSSLSYKLKHVLEFRSKEVLCADHNVESDKSLISEQDLLENADLVFIGTPHSRYKSMIMNKPIIDVWNIRGNGVMI
jgi:UDP-N-acetyl-D-mannosaminuronic acid dehydrogenase